MLNIKIVDINLIYYLLHIIGLYMPRLYDNSTKQTSMDCINHELIVLYHYIYIIP